MATAQITEIDGREVAVSRLEKVFFPEAGFTKGDTMRYYLDVAEVILPHLRDRPLTLKRYPDGITGEHFYEKNLPSHAPGWLETVSVPRAEGDGEIRYLLCNDRAALAWAVNTGDIEKHVLLARAPELHCPTSIVFDLDPGEPAGLLECCRVALHLREVLQAWGLEALVKVSGSKGLHLGVPLNGDLPYEVTQPFAKAVAELAEQQLPGCAVSDMAKARRAGKVLIDWSQNSDFKTTVCVYSLRANRAEPFVSAPVSWEEVARALKKKDVHGLFFTPDAMRRRLRKLGDLWEPMLTKRQKLPAAFTQALAAGPAPHVTDWQRRAGRSSRTKGPRDHSLTEYLAKRDAERTPEPVAGAAPVAGKPHRGGRRRFVIQKHAASHLHYDFRLEMEGVLRSWAVPKGPPLRVRETRLAMHVEDHPMDYAGFEGIIPPGNYGAGTVMVWDEGEYEDQTGNSTAAFYAGKLHITLYGKKLQGEWILVRDRRDDDEGNRWLLIKAGTAQTLPARADDTSAVSGRSMAQIAAAADATWESNRSSAKSTPATAQRVTAKRVTPRFIEPMRCLPVVTLPVTEDWAWEIKLDGYRCLAVKTDGSVTLFSRNEKSLNGRFPQIAAELEELPGEWILDGEVVALDARGRPSFQRLQYDEADPSEIFFYAFDLLQRDEQELRNLPLEERRARLEEFLASPPAQVRLSALLTASPGDILEAVRKLGLEGLVGKRFGSPYEAGERSGAWIKYRVNREQEFVIGGYRPGTRGFDALLVGVYEGKKLMYAGKVKNGFLRKHRETLLALLKKRRADKCPFADLPEDRNARWGAPMTLEKMKECVWVKPDLVAQVAFVEWTDQGHLRHCTFVALRDDKKAKEVVRET